MYTRVPGVDSGIEIRGAILLEAMDLGAALRPPVGPGRSPGGIPCDEATGSFWILEIVSAIKHVSQEVIFTTSLSL
jgi:hypothetical protein